MTVVMLYLVYTIYETDYWVRRQSDFYQALGVSLDADEKKIKSKFRRLYVAPPPTLGWRQSYIEDSHRFFRAAIHHPDKVTAGENNSGAEDFFVNLKVAQDILIDPVKRFAYDRFGPDILNWQHCSSIRDYLFVGLQAAIPLYVGSIIVLVILGVMGYLQWGRFVRYTQYQSRFHLAKAYRN